MEDLDFLIKLIWVGDPIKVSLGYGTKVDSIADDFISVPILEKRYSIPKNKLFINEGNDREHYILCCHFKDMTEILE
jgi:hypothetical protein